MKRRQLIALLGSAAVLPSLRGRAEQPVTLARVGYIGTNRNIPFGAAIYQAFVDEMRARGFTLGQNLAIDFRAIENPRRVLSSDAAELVRSKVDLILTDGTEDALQAAFDATKSIPIVMIATHFDPTKSGYAKSLAHPGGNVTGVMLRQTELAEKQTELLMQAVPSPKRLGIFWDPISANQFAAAERRAVALGLQVQSQKLEHPPYDFDAAFRTMARSSPDMLLVLSSPFFAPARVRIAELAIAYRWPAMFIFKAYAEAGGLMSFGADYLDLHRRLAFYAARILSGARPADLPIEQPDTFELVVNLKTAKVIGLSIPQSLLLRADEVIQ